MFLKKFIGKPRIRWIQSWIVGMILWMVAGPILAQDGWRSFYSPEVAARAAVLMNAATGEVLFSREPHLRLPPASTTKVLSALITLERLAPDSRVWVSPQAASAPPSRIGLHVGETASTEDLLYGLLLKSGNDAAETLAEAAGGSIYGFANLMNAKAQQIGARNSHFMNPHGLPDEDHYSTAYDLALIFRHAMNNPMFAEIVRTRNAALRIESGSGGYGDSRTVSVHNTNRLLASYEGARGGKTGFTRKARRCFVGEVDRGGVRLIVAILNSPSSATLWQDARTLLDYGFARYGLAPPPPMQFDTQPQPVMVRYMPVMTPTAQRMAMVQPTYGNTQEPAVIRRAPVMTQISSRPAITQAADEDEDEADFTPIRRAPAIARADSRSTVAPSTANTQDEDEADFTPIRRTPVTAQADSRSTAAPSVANTQDEEEADFTPIRRTPVIARADSRSTVAPSVANTQDEEEADFTPIRRAPVIARADSRSTVAPSAANTQDDEDEVDLTPIRRTPVTARADSRSTVAPSVANTQDDEDEVDLTPVRHQATIAWTSPHLITDQPAVRSARESTRVPAAARTGSRSTVAQRQAVKSQAKSASVRQAETRVVVDTPSRGKSQLRSQPSVRLAAPQPIAIRKETGTNAKTTKTLLASAKPIVEPTKAGAKTNPSTKTAVMIAMATPSTKAATAKTKAKPASDTASKAIPPKPTAASSATAKSEKRATTKVATRAEPAASKLPQKNTKR